MRQPHATDLRRSRVEQWNESGIELARRRDAYFRVIAFVRREPHSRSSCGRAARATWHRYRHLRQDQARLATKMIAPWLVEYARWTTPQTDKERMASDGDSGLHGPANALGRTGAGTLRADPHPDPAPRTSL